MENETLNELIEVYVEFCKTDIDESNPALSHLYELLCTVCGNEDKLHQRLIA